MLHIIKHDLLVYGVLRSFHGDVNIYGRKTFDVVLLRDLYLCSKAWGLLLFHLYECKNEVMVMTLVSCSKNLQMADVVKDLTAGTVGGAAQLIVGHPFDTIKVKLQSQPAPLPGQPPKYSGAMDAVRQTVAAEGPRGLYKGMGAPLATVAAFNAVLFTVRGQTEAFLRPESGAPLTVNQQVVCGAVAGVAVSFLACPTELIKCRLTLIPHPLYSINAINPL